MDGFDSLIMDAHLITSSQSEFPNEISMINALAEFLYFELVNELNSPINSSLALFFCDVCNKHCPLKDDESFSVYSLI